MNTVIYLDPFQALDEWKRQMATRNDYRSGATSEESRNQDGSAQWTPLVDVIEEEGAFVIKTELPGVGREDVTVKVENDLLTVSGERKPATDEQGKRFHQRERAWGRFTRTFTLPDSTDGAKVTADFKNGLLSVRLPKVKEARPKSINVKVR